MPIDVLHHEELTRITAKVVATPKEIAELAK